MPGRMIQVHAHLHDNTKTLFFCACLLPPHEEFSGPARRVGEVGFPYLTVRPPVSRQAQKPALTCPNWGWKLLNQIGTLEMP